MPGKNENMSNVKVKETPVETIPNKVEEQEIGEKAKLKQELENFRKMIESNEMPPEIKKILEEAGITIEEILQLSDVEKNANKPEVQSKIGFLNKLGSKIREWAVTAGLTATSAMGAINLFSANIPQHEAFTAQPASVGIALAMLVVGGFAALIANGVRQENKKQKERQLFARKEEDAQKIEETKKKLMEMMDKKTQNQGVYPN